MRKNYIFQKEAVCMAFEPKELKYHNHINHAIHDFMRVHFYDSTYDGHIWFGTKQCRNEKLYGKSFFDKDFQEMSAVRVSEARDYINKMHISKFGNYYLTANVLTSPAERRTARLFTINNIVIDIDCHSERCLYDPKKQCKALVRLLHEELFLDNVIPMPNSIVYTGRGVQLWWALDPQYIKPDHSESGILKIYQHVKGIWCKLIDNVLMHDTDTQHFNVDRAASNNLVGYYRMPYTINQHTGEEVVVQRIHDQHYDCYELNDRDYPVALNMVQLNEIRKMLYDGVPVYAPNADEESIVLGLSGTLPYRRIMAILQLRQQRNAPVGDENRDLFCWVVYNNLRFGKLSHEEALRRTLVFNEGFKKPLPERELLNCLSASRTRDGYKMSNAVIIDKLGISKKEQKSIKLFPAMGRADETEHATARTAVQREKRALKYGRAIAMHRLGKNHSAIAREAGLTRATVIKYVRQYEDHTLKPEYVHVSTMYMDRWRNEQLGLPLNTKFVDYAKEEKKWMMAAGIEVADTEDEATLSTAGSRPFPKKEAKGWTMPLIKGGPIEREFRVPNPRPRQKRKKWRNRPPRTSPRAS